MNHYPHHIGDFDRATRHLSRMERSVYRDLLDLYYDTEARLTLDMTALCRRIIARSNEESTAVEQVLNEFFTKTEGGWYNARCEEEIAAYRANNSQRAQAGKASAEAKRLKRERDINGDSTPVERPLNPVATESERGDNGASTNQNQNQNHIKQTTKVVCKKSKSAIPEDFKPDAEGLLVAAGLDLAAELLAFRNHHVGKGSAMADWQAAWQSWVATGRKFGKAVPGGVPARVSDVWHESAGGVDRMAAELGVAPIGAVESRPAFRARVLARSAAGVAA